jgi:hypothetical protein
MNGEQPRGGSGIPAAWYADPSGQHAWRWWDGTGWTEHVHDGGAQPREAKQAIPASAAPHVASDAAPAAEDQPPSAWPAEATWPSQSAGEAAPGTSSPDGEEARDADATTQLAPMQSSPESVGGPLADGATPAGPAAAATASAPAEAHDVPPRAPTGGRSPGLILAGGYMLVLAVVLMFVPLVDIAFGFGRVRVSVFDLLREGGADDVLGLLIVMGLLVVGGLVSLVAGLRRRAR